MANAFNEHPNIMVAGALSSLTDNLVLGQMCAKDVTSDFTSRSNGWKVGDTVSFRQTGDYTVDEYTSGNVTIQDIEGAARSMAIEKHLDISVNWTAREEALDLDSVMDQVITPMAKRLAEKVDIYVGTKLNEGLGLYSSNNLLTTAADVAQARRQAILNQMDENRFCLVDDEYEATLLGQTWFNQSQTRGEPGVSTLQSGTMGRVMGMDWYSSVNFPTSAATQCGDGSFLTNNGGATDNSIGLSTLCVDSGATGGNGIKVGDRLAIAGVKRPLLVATAIATGATAAATSIVLADPINEIIPDNAAVTVISSGNIHTIHGAILDGKALGLAMPMLDMPSGADGATMGFDGISVRLVKQYNVVNKITTLSMDCLVGSKALDPRKICLLSDY